MFLPLRQTLFSVSENTFHLITNLFAKNPFLGPLFKSNFRLLENISKKFRQKTKKKKKNYSLVCCMLVSVDYTGNLFGIGSEVRH